MASNRKNTTSLSVQIFKMASQARLNYLRSLKKYMFERQKGICVYCERIMKITTNTDDMSQCTFDHIIPKSKNSEIVLCCQMCNFLKADKPLNIFFKKWPKKYIKKVLKRINKYKFKQ